jgi:hypothetical protein
LVAQFRFLDGALTAEGAGLFRDPGIQQLCGIVLYYLIKSRLPRHIADHGCS